MVGILYQCRLWHIYYYFKMYLLCENAKLYYLYIEVIQSALMCYIPF